MTLALRRFPDRITRRRHGPGDCNSAGEYVKGMVEEVGLAASVQPLSVEDVDVVEGARLSERLKVYVPEEGVLRPAFDDRLADVVVWLGTEYTVIESRSWPGSHTRATILRET